MSEAAPVVAQTKQDRWKTWALLALSIFCGWLLYFHVSVAKDFVVEVTGGELIVACAILGGVVYFVFRQRDAALLPTSDKLALEVAEWSLQNGYGELDYTRYEVQQTGKDLAMIYFPLQEKTFTYQAGRGVMSARNKDLDESLIDQERSALLTAFEKRTAQQEQLRTRLQNQGFVVEDQ